MRWYEPYYHATLFPDQTARNYVYDEDQDGSFVIRTDNDDDLDATTSEYLWVHFILLDRTEAEDHSPLRLYGHWTNTVPEEETLVTWNPETRQFEAAAYLKQGYYNYQYLRDNMSDAKTTSDNSAPDGDFYETENEYIILVYHLPQGGRYDKLVGYRCLKSKI